jgi:flagellar hook-length control protein FliK
MNDFRITQARNPLMAAQRDDAPRRGEAVAAQRLERTTFDAALQRSATREPTAMRPFDESGVRPPAAPAAPTRDAGSASVRPQTPTATPPAPASRTMKSDEDTRTMQPRAEAGSNASTDTAVDGQAAADTVGVAPRDGVASLASDTPATDERTTADAIPAVGDPGLTAGLIAASMAIGNAAARASVAAQLAEEETDPGSAGEPVAAGADLSETSSKPASAVGSTEVRVDTDSALPGALPALTEELTRSPARDRLMQDFEQRFENSLARAVGAPGSAAGGTSPLLLAGLPPQPTPSQLSAPVAHASIATPLSHPAFGDDLAHRVLLFAGQRLQSAEISLSPADLGPIRVSLELRGQEAAVQFNAAHAATRSAIEDSLPRLREMLAAQGLQLTQADVGDRAPRDPQGGRGGEPSRQQTGLADARSAALGAVVDASTSGTVSGRRVGLIDVRV